MFGPLWQRASGRKSRETPRFPSGAGSRKIQQRHLPSPKQSQGITPACLKTLSRLFERDYFPALVSAAIRTRAMGHLLLPALGAQGDGRRTQEIVGSPFVSPGTGMSFYWVWHGFYPLY